MSNPPSQPDRSASSETTEREELRTIAFRMREIQRLLGVRVEQENRRLEADGIEPVSGPGVTRQPSDEDERGK